VAPVRARPGGVGPAAPPAEAIIHAPWPEADVALHDPALESEFALVQGVVQAVRKLRQERNLGARQTPAVFLSGKDQATVDALAARRGLIAALLSAKAVEIGLKQPRPPQAATEVLKQCEVSIQVPETDVGQEREVAEKRRRELRSYLDREEKKLQNPSFLDRAPANVVEATRQRVSDTRAQLQAVNTILASLAEKPSSGEQE
jgi:valyl-tRNA synthetase